jgi:hypothetical protein
LRWRLRTARSGTATGTFPSRSRARARRHAHRSHPNSSRRGRNPLHAAQKTVDGRAAPLFVGSLPAALAPFPIDPRRHFRLLHLTPAGSHHLCLALMARYTPIDRSIEIGHKKPGRESPCVVTKVSWLQFHHSLARRAVPARVVYWCGHPHVPSSSSPPAVARG